LIPKFEEQSGSGVLHIVAFCINAGHLGSGELDSNQRSLYYEPEELPLLHPAPIYFSQGLFLDKLSKLRHW